MNMPERERSGRSRVFRDDDPGAWDGVKAWARRHEHRLGIGVVGAVCVMAIVACSWSAWVANQVAR